VIFEVFIDSGIQNYFIATWTKSFVLGPAFTATKSNLVKEFRSASSKSSLHVVGQIFIDFRPSLTSEESGFLICFSPPTC
jgi:hypothetical protein